MWQQQLIRLSPRGKGFHLITDEVTQALEGLASVRVGVLHLFIQHTSASLSINENADPTVRGDMERFFLKTVPENAPYYEHTLEGSDDMPAHIRSVLLGSSVSIPVGNGELLLGTWQGLYLGEHRDEAGSRRLMATLQGEAR
ncbi:MAG: secondary thiamine-phosphate synthase enzyme YjbQ [Oleiphilaceae bacterium]|nr:secondary thiamine-phosphate synthase enzyme YjbQ [Oleiphilaceae bacterium]